MVKIRFQIIDDVMNNNAHLVLVVAGLLYLVSLTQVGFVVQESNVWPGWGILIFGFLGIFSGHLTNLIWLANPLVFAAWAVFFTSSKSAAFAFSLLSFVIAASFLLCKTVLVSEGGGSGYEVTLIGFGYWLWLGSILLTVIAGAISLSRNKHD